MCELVGVLTAANRLNEINPTYNIDEISMTTNCTCKPYIDRYTAKAWNAAHNNTVQHVAQPDKVQSATYAMVCAPKYHMLLPSGLNMICKAGVKNGHWIQNCHHYDLSRQSFLNLACVFLI